MAFKRGEESEEICAKASRLAIVTMATQEVKTEGKLCWLVWKRCLRMCVCVCECEYLQMCVGVSPSLSFFKVPAMFS